MSLMLPFSSPVLRPRSLFATALGLLLTPALLAASQCVQPDASGTVITTTFVGHTVNICEQLAP